MCLIVCVVYNKSGVYSNTGIYSNSSNSGIYSNTGIIIIIYYYKYN